MHSAGLTLALIAGMVSCCQQIVKRVKFSLKRKTAFILFIDLYQCVFVKTMHQFLVY